MKPRKLIKLNDLESFSIPSLPNFVSVVFAGHKGASVDIGSLSAASVLTLGKLWAKQLVLHTSKRRALLDKETEYE